MSQADLINTSLRCFVLGLAGLVPVLGIPACVMAMNSFRRVTMREGDAWNPAQRYLLWGFFLGAAGLLISSIGTMLISFVLIRAAFA